MVVMAVGTPTWAVALIAAVAAILGASLTALVNYLTKRNEIRATDVRQWDLNKFESVTRFMALCDAIARVTWPQDNKGQLDRYDEANRERIGLLLLSNDLGRCALNLLEASRAKSQAKDDYDRQQAAAEKDSAFKELIRITQGELHRS